MKTRLIRATGYYAIVNAIACLYNINNHDTNNVLLVENSNQDSNIIINIAQLFPFTSVIIYNKEEFKNLKIILKKLKNDYPNIVEFWDCNLHFQSMLSKKKITNNLKKYLNYPKFILYDEGLETYISIAQNSKDMTLIETVYLLHPQIIDVKYHSTCNIQAIDITLFKNILNKLSIDIKNVHINNNACLFIDSHIVNVKHKTSTYHAEQIVNQATYINYCINKLNMNIYYKLHPRSPNKIDELLPYIHNKDNFFLIDSAYPVEVFLLENKFSLVVGELSTVLINTANIFNIPVYTYNNKYKYEIQGNRSNKLLVNYYIPNLDVIIEGGANYLDYYQPHKEFVNKLQYFLSPLQYVEINAIATNVKLLNNIAYYSLSRYLKRLFLLLILSITPIKNFRTKIREYLHNSKIYKQ